MIKKNIIILLITNIIFAQKVMHNGFYGSYFLDKDVKELIRQKNYKEAFKLLSPKGLKDADINTQLRYDVLSFINGKKKDFFCNVMMNNFIKSPSVPVEVCRYLNNKKTLYGENLQGLLERSNRELPHLSYLIKALIDAQNKI